MWSRWRRDHGALFDVMTDYRYVLQPSGTPEELGGKTGRLERSSPSIGRASPALSRVVVAWTLIILISVAVAAIGAEGSLRLLNKPRPVTSGWRVLAPERMRLQLNQLGFRGHPIQYSRDDFVVLLVGDSQVHAGGCAYDWMPERRLEAHLTGGKPVRVFSLGGEGYGQDQELLALHEYYQRFRSDLVLVWETPGNDIWNNTFPTGDPGGFYPKPTYRLQAGGLWGPSAKVGEVVSSPVRLVALYDRLFGSRDGDWERYLPPPYEPLSDYTGPVNDTWDTMLKQGAGSIPLDNMATEKSHEAIYLTPRSPRSQYGIDLTRRLLGEMSRLAGAHGSGFLTFWVDAPNLEVPDPEAVYSLNGRYYRVSNRQRLANMGDVNDGFESLILPLRTRHWRISPTDLHLNDHAVDDVMRDLAAALKARGAVPTETGQK